MRIFNSFKNRLKYCFYDYWHRKPAMSNKKIYNRNTNSAICKGLNKLSCIKRGSCKFVSACCDEKLARRLSEMGFTPGSSIKIVSGSSRGSIMVEVKGSKLALSNKIADNIFIKEEIKNNIST
ncbi:MAG: ferrous iron transport protein A [Endomicrobium sp.]|jgi:ferrous iron transport protein A|nr:ferrous iron transport protein A [Endomicrobium sp.]